MNHTGGNRVVNILVAVRRSSSQLVATVRVGLIGLAVVNCGERVFPTQAHTDRSTPTAPSLLFQENVDGEKHLRELSRVLPSATGFFLDDRGRLVVSLSRVATDADLLQASKWAAKEAASAGIRGADGAIVPVLAVRDEGEKASLADLLEWRDKAVETLFAIDGVTSLDLDEKLGKIVVGVANDAVSSRALALLRVSGASSEFIATEVSSISPDWPNYPIPADLQSRSRPLAGGVIFGPLGCTLGVAALLPDGTPMLMTNGHCSNNIGFPDGMPMEQPLNTGYTIGTEFHDFSWACPGGRCDHADLGLYTTWWIDVNPLIFEEPYELGLIWRPNNRVLGPNTLGSLNIDQTYPRLVATGMQTYAVMNQVVDKVGAVSGWSYGTVYKTCTTHFLIVNVYKVHCSDFASYTRRPGDSGGPVFIHYPNVPPSEGGNGVSFLGLHFASNIENGVLRGGVFSNTNQIRNEIGNFRFW